MMILGKIINHRYRIDSLMREDALGSFYLARDLSQDDRQVIFNFFNNNAISNRIEDIIRFKMEIHAVSALEHEGILKMYEIGEFVGLHYIASEPVTAETLYVFMAGGLVSLDESVNIIRRICGALELLHSKNIIHKNINPSSVMIGSGRVLLSGFGLSHVRRYDGTAVSADMIEIFKYMSPEQCRILPYGVDERSDLYSLGVIFYRLLTGKDPFYGRDINSIIHKQMAVLPERPGSLNPNIPAALERIVLKLLEKEPDNRYQSARGLLADLDQYLKGKGDFILGLDDRVRRQTYRTRLVGRDKELNRLVTLYGRIAGGKGGACFVTGEAGSGKTRLLEEMKGRIYSRGGWLVEGRCSLQSYKVPYAPFREILNACLNIFYRMAETERKRIIEVIREEYGNFGEILVRLNPAMKEVLGDFPQMVPLGPEKENARFLMVTAGFFLKLSDLSRRLVIILEDLQWADEGTLALISELLDAISGHPLAIVVSYRPEEVPANHTLMKIREKFLNRDMTVVDEIGLDLFDPERMNLLVSSIMAEPSEKTRAVSEFIQGKSRGNPFFAIEVLKRLVDEHVVDYGSKRPEVDPDILSSIVMPNTVVDIILKRMSHLDEGEAKLLSKASVIGEKFSMKLLFKISGLDETEVVRIIDKAIGLHLLVSTSDAGVVSFAHDRIQEAFYASIPAEERKQAHLLVANTIEEENIDYLEDVIFDLANHCIAMEDIDRALIFSFPAGRKALSQYAYADALRYFQLTLDLLDQLELHGTRLWLEVQKNMSKAHLNLQHYDEGIEILQKIIPLFKSKKDRMEAFADICEAYSKKGEWRKCEKAGTEGFRLAGVWFPGNNASLNLGIVKELAEHAIRGIFPRRRRERRTEAHLLFVITAKIILSMIWSYVFTDTRKFVYLVLRALNMAERYAGVSPELGLALGGYGALLMAVAMFNRAAAVHEKAMEMRRLVNDRWGTAQSLQWIGFCWQWKGEYYKSLKYFTESAETFRAIGDMREYGFSLFGMCQCHYYLSEFEAARRYLDDYYAIACASNDNYGMSSYWWSSALWYLKTGDFESAEFCALTCYYFSIDAEAWFDYCVVSCILGQIYLEKGEFAKALAHLEQAKEINEKHNFLRQYVNDIYPLLAEAALADARAGTVLSGPGRRRRMREIRGLCREAVRKTRKWPAQYGISLMVYAKYHAQRGDKDRADRLFRQSIEHYRKTGGRYEQARCQYEYSAFLSQGDDVRSTRANLESAYQVFSEIGAKKYIGIIQNLLGISRDGESETSMERLIESERMTSAIQLARELNRVPDIDESLRATLHRAIEMAGARRGCIFIRDEGNGLEPKNVTCAGGATGALCPYAMRIVERVLATGRPVIIDDALADQRFKEEGFEDSPEGMRSVLCAPIIERDAVIGVCYLDNSLAAGVFGKKEMDLVNLLLSNISHARAIEILRRRSVIVQEGESRVLISTIPTEKLQKAVEYINNNYTSDISREGLASYVGIHHDNLGKYFKIYFGKKISDYINELRIHRAAEILRDTDDKIVNVAFSSGFGSISTFNKAFRQIMKISPEIYRKNLRVNRHTGN
ncbi:MAG: AAA family ATPase [Spirochaetes bacterium]|nr:AAA family ATPase [Spirochaetota bacterium]